MNTVGIDELKKRLSELIRQVERGHRVIVTRHNRPVAEVTAAATQGLNRGRRFGGGRLEPAVEPRATPGTYLKVLAEDRRGREE